MSSSLKILWVKAGPLFPLDSGGKKRSHAMLQVLNRRHSVTYLSIRNPDLPLDPKEESADYAENKIWIDWKEARKGSGKFYWQLASNFFLSSLPYALAKYQSKALKNALDEQARSGGYDVIICDFLAPALNFQHLTGPTQIPLVLFQHNMEAQIWKRMASASGNPINRFYLGKQAARMAKWEEKLSRGFDGVITVSPEDSKIARGEYNLDNVLGDVPTGVDFSYFAEESKDLEPGEGFTLGFLGSMDWMPNIEGVHWFVREAWSSIKDKLPGCRLLIIGRKPPGSVKKLAEEDSQIEVTGTVDDVRPYLSRCHALAVPLLSGGGTRIKIMEALAAGLPVVSTTVGAEGLGLVDGEQILIADSPEEFTDATFKIAADETLRNQIAEAGAQRVKNEHSWEAVTEIFEKLLHKAVDQFEKSSKREGSD